MKKIILASLVAAIMMVQVTPAYCETPAFTKFRRGFCNLFTFHLEIGNQMKKAEISGGAKEELTLGIVKGIAMAGVRALVGVYEVVTFPLPLPPKYEPILTDPEFFWKEPFSSASGR